MVNKLFYKFDYIFYFLFFIFIGLYLNLNDYVELATNDDRSLWDLLINGENGTLILSYPLSSVLVKLYQFFPQIQWYSLLLTTIMIINSYFFALYISMQKQIVVKRLLVILFSVFLINYWVNLSITLLTVSLLVTAILFIQHKFIFFISLLIVASFLRTGMIVIFFPLIILSIILLYKFPFKKSHIAFLILFFTILAVNVFSPKLNPDYSNWLSFNKAKSYFIDLHKNDQNHILTEEQNNLLKLGWWIQDEELLPSSLLIKSAGSRIVVLQDSIKRLNMKYFKKHRYNYLIYLLLITIIIIGTIRRKKYLMLYLLLFSAVMFVIFTKDVERTTMPLLFIIVVIIIASFSRIAKSKYYVSITNTFLLLSILILLGRLPGQFSNRDMYYNEIKPLKKEFLNLLTSSEKECEMSINFPTPFSPASSVLMGNKLFDEKNWISFKYTLLLPTGWLSRHPFFYKSHHISTQERQRQYKNYYEFLMDKKTAFIASKGLTSSANADNILHMYDEIYNQDNNCKHQTMIIKTSKNFAISKIQNNCENNIKANK